MDGVKDCHGKSHRKGGIVCEFCENIHDIELDGEPETEDCKFPLRGKLILVKEDGKYRFYGFNKYPYEDDVCYQNVEIAYCPKCGRKLREMID